MDARTMAIRLCLGAGLYGGFLFDAHVLSGIVTCPISMRWGK